ncbi:MAG: hypothetical protein ACI87E_001658 [Mariniblastus sp.]|jgi:hypothetical protein
MVVDPEKFLPFQTWLVQNLPTFGLILLAAVVLGVLFGYIVATFRHGPFEAFYTVAQVISQAIPDFMFTSPRRVFAIARLAIKEALRRKVILVTFAIFAASLLFGGWFMDNGSENPDQIYVNFVLWGTQLLILLMGMLISAFSLPDDIKNKTIYTVVTKPVRPTEIVLGRIVGFGLLGTGLLLLMGVISFFFVWRGLAHTHQIVGNDQTLSSFVDVPEDKISRINEKRVSDNAIMEARTNIISGHSHRLEVIEYTLDADDPDPQVTSNILKTKKLEDGSKTYTRIVCVPVGGHTHNVTITGEGPAAKISLGPAVGYFRARVPVYAKDLSFYDRQGNLKKKGLNVGKEWEYRSYVDGGTPMAGGTSLSKARFEFDNLTESRFGGRKIVPLEMTLGVFRTYKADIEKRVMAGIQFESVPVTEQDNKFVSEVIDFETNEYSVQLLPLKRKILGKEVSPDGKLVSKGEYDLFDDFAGNDGRIILNLSCRDYNQYLGTARGDLYFRASDQVYWWNFAKGYVGIWCQMMIIIAMGVALSTFLNAPITMLGTLVMIIIGFFTQFIRDMAIVDGGGPIESMIRVITQKNMVLDLDTNSLTTAIEFTDRGLMASMKAVTFLAPNFSQLNFSDYLTFGYAIDIHRIFTALTITFAFCLGLTILGYFALKTREIAK